MDQKYRGRGAEPTGYLPYLGFSQVCYWIRDRDPRDLESFSDVSMPDEDLVALNKKIGRTAFDTTKWLEVLSQLLDVLEAGRIKATGRLKWTGNPRTLPAHYW